jgi:hypothetical protein
MHMVCTLQTTQAAKKLQVVGTGVKAFERNASTKAACGYRVCYEALSELLPYMTKRVHYATARDFSCFVRGGVVRFSTLDSDVLKAGLAKEGMVSVVCILVVYLYSHDSCCSAVS